MVDAATKKTLASIPLLKTKAGDDCAGGGVVQFVLLVRRLVVFGEVHLQP